MLCVLNWSPVNIVGNKGSFSEWETWPPEIDLPDGTCLLKLDTLARYSAPPHFIFCSISLSLSLFPCPEKACWWMEIIDCQGAPV